MDKIGGQCPPYLTNYLAVTPVIAAGVITGRVSPSEDEAVYSKA